jgi:hypothetical protein
MKKADHRVIYPKSASTLFAVEALHRLVALALYFQEVGDLPLAGIPGTRAIALDIMTVTYFFNRL